RGRSGALRRPRAARLGPARGRPGLALVRLVLRLRRLVVGRRGCRRLLLLLLVRRAALQVGQALRPGDAAPGLVAPARLLAGPGHLVLELRDEAQRARLLLRIGGLVDLDLPLDQGGVGAGGRLAVRRAVTSLAGGGRAGGDGEG